MSHLGEISGLACALVWTFSTFLWARVGKNLTALSINTFKAVTGFVMITIVAILFLFLIQQVIICQ